MQAPDTLPKMPVGKEFTNDRHPHMTFTVIRQPKPQPFATFAAYCGHTDLHISRRVNDPDFVVRPLLSAAFPTHFTTWLNNNPLHKNALISAKDNTDAVIAAYNATLDDSTT